ncbi:MAG TPA: type II secretion system protein GspC [Candidatus Binatia bacterium]|nr:type II secretion system protein GspC [Candidatus Binatia bacterium]
MAALSFPEPWSRGAGALYERHGRRLPALAAALFALLLGGTLADLVWSLVPVPPAARWQAPPAVPAAAARGDASADLDVILNAALFGRYQAPSVTTAVEAPDTPLNLILMGVLAADRPDDSRALIAQGTDEKAYAIGDDVARGVTLQAIFPDRVMLARNGALETLRLERDSAPPAAPGPVATAEEAPAAGGQAPPLAQIREEVVKDPTKAQEYVRVQPANVAGQLKGYRVYPGRDRSVFAAAGLRPGDLVTAVNGVQLDDPAKALQVLGNLTQSTQMTLTIERGGQPQTLSVNLQ